MDSCVLPDELLMIVISYLSIQDLRNIRLVCRRFDTEALAPLYREVNISLGFRNTLKPYHFYCILVTNPKVAKHVQTLTFRRWRNFEYSPEVLPERDEVLAKYSYLDVQLRNLVRAGVISSEDKLKWQGSLEFGCDDPLWLVLYSMLPNLKHLQFGGNFYRLSNIMERLISYLLGNPTHTVPPIHRITFPKPSSVVVFPVSACCRPFQNNYLASLTLMPSILSMRYYDVHPGHHLQDIQWLSSPMTGSDNTPLTSNIQSLRSSLSCFLPIDMAKLVMRMPRLRSLCLKVCPTRGGGACRRRGNTILSYDNVLHGPAQTMRFYHYKRELKAMWTQETGLPNFPCRVQMITCKVHQSARYRCLSASDTDSDSWSETSTDE